MASWKRQEPDPDPWVNDKNPRMRIPTKMSWIHNTRFQKQEEQKNLTQEEDEVSMVVMTDAVAGKHAVVFPLQNAHVARAAHKYV